jgi:hypothetical protein
MPLLDWTESPLRQKLMNSHIEDKLENNEVLLPNERSEVESLLENGMAEVEACETEIERLQAPVKLVQDGKTGLVMQLQRAKSLLAPIRTFPLELLTLVFEIYVEKEGGIDFSKNIVIPTLGAVCRRWRNITLHTPSIWSRLRVHLAQDIGEYGLKTILSRSCTQDARLPLVLEICYGSSKDNEIAVNILNVLVEECYRWKSLTLSNDETQYNDAAQILSAISGNIPILEHLDFKGGFMSSSSMTPSIHTLILDAPSLISVHIDDMSTNIMLPYSQLKSIRCTVYEDLAQNLKLFCNTQSLSLQLRPETNEGWIQGHTQKLRCKYLHLTLPSQWWVEKFANCANIISGISCPELEILKISDDFRGMNQTYHENVFRHHLEPVQSFLKRSNHLHSLSLERLAFAAGTDISALFEGIPLLESLTVLGLPDRLSRVIKHHFIFDLPFLKALTRSPHGTSPFPTILPRLTRLEFGIENPMDRFSVTAFQALVESRWLPDGEVDGVACLREVVVSSPDKDLVNELDEALRTVKDLGMKIDVFTHACDCEDA